MKYFDLLPQRKAFQKSMRVVYMEHPKPCFDEVHWVWECGHGGTVPVGPWLTLALAGDDPPCPICEPHHYDESGKQGLYIWKTSVFKMARRILELEQQLTEVREENARLQRKEGKR